jgi:hypothetical protein
VTLPQDGEHRVKLRSSVLAGFVSFNSLLGCPVIPSTSSAALGFAELTPSQRAQGKPHQAARKAARHAINEKPD